MEQMRRVSWVAAGGGLLIVAACTMVLVVATSTSRTIRCFLLAMILHPLLGCHGPQGVAQEPPTQDEIRRLIRMLASDSIEERGQAAQKLKEAGKAAVPDLRAAAESEDPEVAVRANHLLRVIEIRGQLTKRLLVLLPGVDERLAQGDDHAWTQVFLEAGRQTFGGEVSKQLKSGDLKPLADRAFQGVLTDEEEGWVCRVIGERQLHHMTPHMMKMLREESQGSRIRATRTLGDLRVKEAVPEIVRLMKEVEHIAYTGAAYYALSRMGKEAVLPSLLPVVKDKDCWVRSYAVELLGDLGAREAVPAIMERLKDDDSYVRKAAVEALATLGAKEAAGEIAKLLEGDTAHVAVSASLALADLQAKDFIPNVAKWLDTRHPPYVQEGIARALCMLGSPTGIEWCLDRASRDSKFDLDPLNAVRRPDVWQRLRGKRIDWDGEMELGERIARGMGLTWDASGLGSEPERKWIPGFTEVEPRGWAVRNLDLALSGVHSEGYEYILESDRIRLLPRDKALDFWKEWWSRERKQ